MTRQEHRKRLEANALRLDRARGLLNRAHLQFILVGDVMAAYRVQRIITSVHAEHKRWLHAVGSLLS